MNLLRLTEIFPYTSLFLIFLIIGFPTFFILRWILKKFIKKEIIRIISNWTGTLIITPTIFFSGIIFYLLIVTYYPKRVFNKEQWLNQKETRYEMSKDIITQKILIGKTKSEVIEILGIEKNKMNDESWNYDLGTVPRFISIDPDVLTIKFTDGKVSQVKQQKT
jgi:hypothetical protein